VRNFRMFERFRDEEGSREVVAAGTCADYFDGDSGTISETLQSNMFNTDRSCIQGEEKVREFSTIPELPFRQVRHARQCAHALLGQASSLVETRLLICFGLQGF